MLIEPYMVRVTLINMVGVRRWSMSSSQEIDEYDIKLI